MGQYLRQVYKASLPQLMKPQKMLLVGTENNKDSFNNILEGIKSELNKQDNKDIQSSLKERKIKNFNNEIINIDGLKNKENEISVNIFNSGYTEEKQDDELVLFHNLEKRKNKYQVNELFEQTNEMLSNEIEKLKKFKFKVFEGQLKDTYQIQSKQQFLQLFEEIIDQHGAITQHLQNGGYDIPFGIIGIGWTLVLSQYNWLNKISRMGAWGLSQLGEIITQYQTKQREELEDLFYQILQIALEVGIISSREEILRIIFQKYGNALKQLLSQTQNVSNEKREELIKLVLMGLTQSEFYLLLYAFKFINFANYTQNPFLKQFLLKTFITPRQGDFILIEVEEEKDKNNQVRPYLRVKYVPEDQFKKMGSQERIIKHKQIDKIIGIQQENHLKDDNDEEYSNIYYQILNV